MQGMISNNVLSVNKPNTKTTASPKNAASMNVDSHANGGVKRLRRTKDNGSTSQSTTISDCSASASVC